MRPFDPVDLLKMNHKFVICATYYLYSNSFSFHL